MTDRTCEAAFFAVLWSDDLWAEMNKHMYHGKKKAKFDSYIDGDAAAANGYLELIKRRSKHMMFNGEAMKFFICLRCIEKVFLDCLYSCCYFAFYLYQFDCFLY